MSGLEVTAVIGAKICPKCEEEKPLSEFHKNSSSKDGRGGYCKSCMAEYNKQYYHKEIGDESGSLLRNRAIVVKALMAGCSKCGESDVEVLHFHHRDPDEKETRVSALISGATNRLLGEIEKCDVLCANCHSRQHPSGWKYQYVEMIETLEGLR